MPQPVTGASLLKSVLAAAHNVISIEFCLNIFEAFTTIKLANRMQLYLATKISARQTANVMSPTALFFAQFNTFCQYSGFMYFFAIQWHYQGV